MSRVNFLAMSGNSAEELLEQALPQLVAASLGAKSAAVYRMSRGGLVLWHSSETESVSVQYLELDSNLAFQEALERKEIVVKGRLVVVPLINSAEVYALLLMQYADEATLDDVAENALELSLVLYQRHLEALFRQQIHISQELNDVDSLNALAAVLAKTILNPEQYIAVIVFDEDGTTGHVVVTANRKQVFQQNVTTGVDPAAVDAFYRILDAEGEALISDSSSDTRFAASTKAWLASQKVKSMYMLPLHVGKRLYGFIALIDTQRSLDPSPLEKQLYQNIAAQASIVIEKREFLAAAERTVAATSAEARSLHLLNKLATTANTANTEAPILQQTSEALLEITGVDHVGIVLIENMRGFVVSESPVKGILGFEVESGAGSIAEVVRESRKPLVVPSVVQDTEMPVGARKVMQDLGIEAVVILPMFDLDGNLLGTVGLDYYSKQKTIEANMVELAQTFVAQVALSLQKLRLLANLQQQAAQMEKVNHFGQAIRSHLIVRDILGTALRYSNDLVEADYLGILLYENRQLLRKGLYWQKKTELNPDIEVIVAETDNIALKVLETLEAVTISELQAEWIWKHPFDKELQSFIAMPLLSAGKILGVLEVGNLKAHAYNSVDIAAIQQMGNQVAGALANAEAYAQSQKLARHKSLANEIITKLQRQADVQEILQVTVQELGEALGAKRGRIRLGTVEKKQ